MKPRRTSLKDLADHLGVSFQQVQKYERGANRVSASMLVRIAQKLDTTVGELVGETSTPVSDESLFEKLAVPGAVQLLEAFASVQQPSMRTAILNLKGALDKYDIPFPAIPEVGITGEEVSDVDLDDIIPVF